MRKSMNLKKLQQQSRVWLLAGVALATLSMTGIVSQADDGAATTGDSTTVTATTDSQATDQTSDHTSDSTTDAQTGATDEATYDANTKTGVSENDGTKTTTYDDGSTTEEITDRINLSPRPTSHKQAKATTGQAIAKSTTTTKKTSQPAATAVKATTGSATTAKATTVTATPAKAATVKSAVTTAPKAEVVAASAVKTAKATKPVTVKTTKIATTATTVKPVSVNLTTKPAITIVGNGTPTTTPISMAGGLLLALTTLTGLAGVSRKLRQA